MNQIGVIQILRAVAALAVVFSHAQNDAIHESLGSGVAFAPSSVLPWDAGVDLFFVISGFIMVHASERLFATSGAGAAFLLRRIVRIVPLYWIVTGVGLAIIAIVTWQGKRTWPGADEIAASLAFLPYAQPGAVARPIVPQGWTLNYEMAFYAVFALYVPLPRHRAILAVGATLLAGVAAGAVLRPSATALAYWSDPIVLEFALGMAVACLRQTGLRLPGPAAWLLAMVGLLILSCDFGALAAAGDTRSGALRLVAWGAPTALIFAACVLVRDDGRPRGRMGSAMAALGDASYALYLFHPLAIIAARKVFLAAGLAPEVGYWPLLAAELPLAAALGIVLHRGLERPMTRSLHSALRRAEHRRRPACAGGAEP